MSDFPPRYAEQLKADFPRWEMPVEALAEPPSLAPSIGRFGIEVPYRMLGDPENAHNNPTLVYVNGFGEEGHVNKAPLALWLSESGFNVVLIEQTGKWLLNDENGKPSPTRTQADDLLSVVADVKRVLTENYGQEDPVVHPVAHSYGGLILDNAIEQDPRAFKDSHAILLAPAGTNSDETLPSLATRWLKMMKSEVSAKRPMDCPDKKGHTGKASQRVLLGRPKQTLLEIKALLKETIDYTRLSSRVGRLTVMTYLHDEMFPPDVVDDTIMRHLAAEDETGQPLAPNMEWLMPGDFAAAYRGFKAENGIPMSAEEAALSRMRHAAEGSVHDDEQFNVRVASAIAQLFGKYKPWPDYSRER